MRRWLGGLASLIVLGFVGYGLFASFRGVPSIDDHPVSTDERTIARGKYLAAAGDCVSCHTAQEGESFAGGRAFDTPFGRIYSRNITPDPETGIGGMTSAQFYQLIAYGADSVFSPLYPAMPYTSFHFVTREDSDALYAYFMSIPAVHQPAVSNALAFPFDIRPLMFGWNLLFASRGPFEADPERDTVWNRGAYLVEGLGHCGECHTPRNRMGAMERGKRLEGAAIADFEAPDITPGALAARGWSREDLVLYFQTGASPRGTAFSTMFPVVKNSLRHLSHDDRVAIATYLMDVTADTPSKGEAAVAALGDAANDNRSGQALYLSNCSLCHGPRGQGIASTMPALSTNATLAQPDGVNLVTVIARGLAPQSMSLTEAYGPMPAFGDRLSAAQIADIANYIRSAFSDSAEDLPKLSEAEVAKILE